MFRLRPRLAIGWVLLAIAGGVWWNARQPETIDTLAYFVSRHPEIALVGDALDPRNPGAVAHSLSQTVVPGAVYYVKWHPNAYELYRWDADYITLTEDHTWNDPEEAGRSRPYSMDPGLWMKRRMKVGEALDVGANRRRFLYARDCQPGRALPLSYKTVLERHVPRFDAGGELGIQDVIVLRYDYSYRTGLPDRQGVNAFERFYYSREWGWIQWEYYEHEDIARQPVLRKQMRYNRKAAAKILPNLANKCQGARFVSQRMDGRPMPPRVSLVPGETHEVVVDLENTGGSTWVDEPALRFRLGAVGDHSTWGGRVDLAPGARVAPGQVASFRFPITAPRQPGVYPFEWRMVVEGAEWFGDSTPVVLVRVR